MRKAISKNKFFRILSLVCLVNLLIQGCITPPRLIKSSVLPAKEVEAATRIKNGQNFVATGRLDLAEIEFRHITEVYPKLLNANNNLGYVLLLQNRLAEAQKIFKNVLAVDQNNLVARENLAHVLYQQGNYEEAAKEYQQLLVKNTEQQLFGRNIIFGSSDNQLSPTEVYQTFRNLAIINYALGITDEALCYSMLAWQTAGTVAEAGQHSRMLLSLNKIDQALNVLRLSVSFEPGSSSAKLLLDYGISLYAKQDFPLAMQALDKMQTSISADESDKRIGNLVRLVIQNKQLKTPELSSENETITDSELCDPELIDIDHYWPQVLIDDVLGFMDKHCGTGWRQHA